MIMRILKIALSVFICLTFSGLGLAQDEGQCQIQGSKVGNGEGQDEISLECIALFKSKALPGARKKNLSGETEVYGYKNIIFFETKSEVSYITGKSSRLKDVQFIVLDELNQEVVVLEKSGTILTFSSRHKGNIGPKRILKTKELSGIKEIGIDHKKNQILAFKKEQGKVFVYSRLANTSGKKLQKKLDLVKTIDGVGVLRCVEATGELNLYRPNGEFISR
jgi:hypothetical protein